MTRTEDAAKVRDRIHRRHRHLHDNLDTVLRWLRWAADNPADVPRPDHPDLDVTVERARDGDPLHKLMAPAKAVRDHLATHHQEQTP